MGAADAGSGGNGGLGKAELAIEFERPGVDGERTGVQPGPRRTVDEAERHTAPMQRQGQHEAGGTGTDNQYRRRQRRRQGSGRHRSGRHGASFRCSN